MLLKAYLRILSGWSVLGWSEYRDRVLRGLGIKQLPAWLAWGVPLLHKPTT
jgi:hypothetical protein